MSHHRAVVVLIVQSMFKAAVLFVLAEIHSEEYLTTDMDFPLNGVGAFSSNSR